jgi:hypothetical protein
VKRFISIVVPLVTCAVLSACHASDDSPAAPQLLGDGVYSGVYTRVEHSTSGQPTTTSGGVNLSIEGDRYSIRGEIRYAPPSGSGLFIVGDVVTFTDDAFRTAEFDWTLIVNGEFGYDQNDSSVVLEQYDETHDRHVRIELTREQ